MTRRWFVPFVTVIAILLGVAAPAFAQGAWVDVPGSLSAGVDYTFGTSDTIIDTEGEDLAESIDDADLGITNQSLAISLDYAPIENLGISASLPLLFVKFGGVDDLFPRHGEYDDGDSHFVAQDFRANVRYQLFGPSKVVTPHIGVTIPVTGYETQGYAGAGRGLKKLHLGGSVGALFDPWLPRLFFHGRYEFSLSERYTGDDEYFQMPGVELSDLDMQELDRYNQNSSDLNLQLGFFITEVFEIHGAFDAHWIHGGFDFSEFTDPETPQVVLDHHDPLLNEDYYLVGGGASYYLTDALRANVFFRLFLEGKNTRDVNAFGLGLSYTIL